MKRLVYFYQGKCLKGRDSIVLGGPSSLNPLRDRGSGPLTPWGTGVHLDPGDLGPSVPSQITPPVNDDFLLLSLILLYFIFRPTSM